MSLEVQAFAPGRVNLIGEHTDYNGGLALPFAIAEGVTVQARRSAATTHERGEPAADPARISAYARDVAERDEFAVAEPPPGKGWRAFVRGVAAELRAAGVEVPGADLEIHGDVPRGAGLSSSAALEVALALALLGLADTELDRLTLARLCSRVENEWVGARTGLLDQLASLLGETGCALQIDFWSLDVVSVPLALEDGWRIAILDSGESRALAASGYNERRAECVHACELLGVSSLRELELAGGEPSIAISRLPETLARRVRHVLSENARVRDAVAAIGAGDLARLGWLLDASHASLREQYECSTPAVEATVAYLHGAGAAGARIMGGGFGGSVLALFPPDAHPPPGAREVRPSHGALVQGGRGERPMQS
jgi:galactokinase